MKYTLEITWQPGPTDPARFRSFCQILFGMMDAAEAKTRPAYEAESQPAGGVETSV